MSTHLQALCLLAGYVSGGAFSLAFFIAAVHGYTTGNNGGAPLASHTHHTTQEHTA